MIAHRSWSAQARSIRAAILAAYAAEGVFMIMVALIAMLRGADPWRVVKVPASFVLGPAATRPPGFFAGDVVFGLFMHLFFATVVAVLYARLLPVLGMSPLAGGLVAGLPGWLSSPARASRLRDCGSTRPVPVFPTASPTA